jgi:hypothetical protein
MTTLPPGALSIENKKPPKRGGIFARSPLGDSLEIEAKVSHVGWYHLLQSPDEATSFVDGHLVSAQ